MGGRGGAATSNIKSGRTNAPPIIVLKIILIILVFVNNNGYICLLWLYVA